MDNGLSVCHNQADARTQPQRLVKSHQNKTHKQTITHPASSHVDTAAVITRSGGSSDEGGGRKMASGTTASPLVGGWEWSAGGSVCVRKPFTHDKFCKGIDLCYDSLTPLLALLMQFACNLLSSALMSNFQLWHLGCLFIFYLFICPLLSFTHSGTAMTPELLSHLQKQPLIVSQEKASKLWKAVLFMCSPFSNKPVFFYLQKFNRWR